MNRVTIRIWRGIVWDDEINRQYQVEDALHPEHQVKLIIDRLLRELIFKVFHD